MDKTKIFSILRVSFLLIIVMFLLYGLFYHSMTCGDKCRKNPKMIKEAEVSGHGIDHTCFDYCEGGTTMYYKTCFFDWCKVSPAGKMDWIVPVVTVLLAVIVLFFVVQYGPNMSWEK